MRNEPRRDMTLPYRPEIDGMRAFAVVAVILFHAFPAAFRGGFLGVDIFFVISGFLITGILLKDAESGSVSLARFYARRIRRIFPALIVVLCCSLLLGSLLLLPDEYRALGRHVAGGAFFVDNILLWHEAGYFDAESAAKPLLHLWSLGIEEQYYLFFPLLVAVFARKPVRLFRAILIIALISFVCHLCIARSHPVAAFYLPVTRVWELLSGALLACLWQRTDIPARIPCPLLVCALGLGLVTAGFVLAGDWQGPGWPGLFSVLGACCLISTAGGNPLGRFLFCNRLSVYCGKISYPLYLWHWPLLSLSFITGFQLTEDATLNKLLLVSIALAAACLTCHGIENRVRFRKGKATVATLLCLMLATGLSGLMVHHWKSFPVRAEAPRNQDYLNRVELLEAESYARCLRIFPDWKELNDGNICRTQDSLDSIDTAIIGDSHASHLFAGLALAGSGHSFAVFPASGAAPFVDVMSYTRQGQDFRKNGITLINRAYDAVLTHANIKNVILAHRPFCSYRDIIDARNPKESNRDIILENAMRRSLTLLVNAGKHVIVVLDNPGAPIHPRNCYPRPLDILNDERGCTFEQNGAKEDAAAQKWYGEILSRVLTDFPSVVVVDISKPLCADGLCHFKLDGDILYTDKDHLSPFGSRLVSEEILPALK